MAGSHFQVFGTGQEINLDEALRRAEWERSMAIRNGLRRLWTTGLFSRAAAKSIR